MTRHSRTPAVTSIQTNLSQVSAPVSSLSPSTSRITLQSGTPSTQSLTTASTPSASTSTPSAVEMTCVNERRHHVKMTLFGAVCFHPGCMTRLGKSFRVSHQTLRKHFHEANCYTGESPDCTNLARDLCQDLSTLRDLVLTGGHQADQLVERVLPGNGVTRSNCSYCLNCGLVGKPSALRNQHYTDNNKKCSLHHLRTGTVLTSSTIRKVKIPQEVVNLIRKGAFDYGDYKDPKRKRISGRLQSIEELSCQASGNKLVSPGSLFFRFNSISDVT